MENNHNHNHNGREVGLTDDQIRTWKLKLSDKRKASKVEELTNCLILNTDHVERIRNIFLSEMEKGMRDESSSLQMENTYMPELPDGTEDGKYLALDLGGTNFRMLLIQFSNGKLTNEEVKYYHIANELRLGPGEELFDYLADSVIDFVTSLGLSDTALPLGFSFSFPMVHHSIKSGVLVSWTKSFNCSNVVGKDVVKLLMEALERRGKVQVRVDAVLNDTTGTLMMGAMLDTRTCIGLILGTGSNACYLERADRVHHWETERHGEKEVVIDIEWGAFGDNGVLDFIKTEYDVQVDKNSLLVNSFTFEKYIAGKYLGEVARVVIVELARNGVLFNGIISKQLAQIDNFTTAFVSTIEQDTVDNTTSNTKRILDNLQIDYSDDDISIVKYVCAIVSNRSAMLVAINLAVLLDRIDKEEVTIAVDGSLCEKHPNFRMLLYKYIELQTDKKFHILQVSDGSGKGAGVVAAIADKLERRFGLL